MTEINFFPQPDALALRDIVNLVEGELLRGDESLTIDHLSPIDSAQDGALIFIDNSKYIDDLRDTGARVCLAPPKHVDKVPSHIALIQVNAPYEAYAKVSRALFPLALRPLSVVKTGTISPLTSIDETAQLEDGVTVEPFAVIGADAQIGSGSIISSGVKIGSNVTIGRNCSISSNCVVQHACIGDNVIMHPGCMVGQDGFGFAMSPQGHSKVPQLGKVVIQDDVEIGANTTVDRGAIRDTIIGQGTKIDNQVQIAHNVVIGRHCVIVSQVGIAGSTTLGDFVAMGGQAGSAGHVNIGMGAQIAGASAIHGDVPAGGRYAGIPAKPLREWMREQSALKRLVKQNKKDT